MKNSFVLYHDYTEKFKSLSDEQFGKLIRCMLAYDASGEVPRLEDAFVEMAFNIARLDLERNGAKYEAIIEKRREAGRKGGLAKSSNAKQNVANVANASFAKQTVANVAVNVNDNVNVNVNDNDKNNIKDLIFNKDIDNNKVNTKEKTNKKEKPVYFPNDEVLNQAFEEFVKHRKLMKKPMGDRAIELAIKKLEELSGGDNDLAVKIINQSIFRGWQGLFELSDEGKTSPINSHQAYIDKWRDA